ncbi:MAG: cyclophilin-like fold protein [Candidatus Thorarchaeota archaeon]
MNRDTGLLPIKIDLFGIGTLEGHIIRHIAPLSADAIINKLPIALRGRFSFGSQKYWTLPGLGIYKGTNSKSKNEVEGGDIIYNPKTDEIIFVLESHQMPNKVNKVGKIITNLDLLRNARNGLNTKISRKT